MLSVSICWSTKIRIYLSITIVKCEYITIVKEGQSNQYTALSNTTQHWREHETGETYKIALPVNLVYSVSHMWADFLG